MNELNDYVLIIIFKKLNLNERSPIRLVNKRFKFLIDSIQIKKLVLYNQLPQYDGIFEYTDKSYQLKDTANTLDLNKFFNNPILIKQMKTIELLKIIGRGFLNSKVDLKDMFEKLNYISLNSIYLTENTMLKSPNLNYLVINNSRLATIFDKHVHFSSREESMKKTLKNIYLSQLKPSIKSISINYKKDLGLVACLIKENLIENVENLRIRLEDLNLLNILISTELFPKLKCLHAQITDVSSISRDKFFFLDFSKNLANHYKNLEIYLFGLRFTESTAPFIINFLTELIDHKLFFKRDKKFCLYFNSLTNSILEQYIENENLIEFFKLIDVLDAREDFNDNLLELFDNLKVLTFMFYSNPTITFFKKYMENFIDLEQLVLMIPFDNHFIQLDNRILDLVPNYQIKLKKLTIFTFNKINFNFLFQLKDQLVELCMMLFYQFEQSNFLKLIKEFKYLDNFHIQFNRTDDLTNANLTELKDKINNCLKEELKIEVYDFKIQIHKKKDVHLIRVYYQKGCQTKISTDLDEKMFNLIRDKKKQIDRI